jgi:hypothetical protein
MILINWLLNSNIKHVMVQKSEKFKINCKIIFQKLKIGRRPCLARHK